MTSPLLNLSQLSKNIPARITGFTEQNGDLETRLREIGFAEGDKVQVQHRGLFGGNPITVSLNGALIALRKQDAAIIRIEALAVAS